jgi:hypothetical protein
MGDQISIQQGFPPWQPTEDTELLETYDFYDMPLAGLVLQGGNRYVFWCEAGKTEDSSLWAYLQVDERDLSVLENSDDLYTGIVAIRGDKPLVVAISREGHGIVSSALLARPTEFPTLAKATLEAFRSSESNLEHLIAG